jgi:hypothetical protein
MWASPDFPHSRAAIALEMCTLSGEDVRAMHLAHGCRLFVALVYKRRLTYLQRREVNERRFTMFKQLKKITRALRAPSAEEREMNYLNGSLDRIDLEYRQRQVDRGLFRSSF